jgi:hypothetical protein
MEIIKDKLALLIPIYKIELMAKDLCKNIRQIYEVSKNIGIILFSDDNSGDVIGEQIIKDNLTDLPYVFEKQKNNKGETGNTTYLICLAREFGYEWAILLHQDDIVDPLWPKLAKQYIDYYYEDGCEIGLVSCQNIYMEIENKQKLEFVNEKEFGQNNYLFKGLENGIKKIGNEFSWNVPGSLFNTCTYLKVGGFLQGLTYAADNDFLVRYFMSGEILLFVKNRHVCKYSGPQSSSVYQIRNGDYAIGWSYLMQKYIEISGKAVNKKRLLCDMVFCIKQMLKSFFCGDFKLVFGQFKALSIFSRAYLAIVFKNKKINHKKVLQLLEM